MKFKKLIFFLFIVNTTFAQLGDQTYLAEYQKGVALFNEGNFEKAIQTFNPLCQKAYSNAVSPYAYFYNAIANKNIGNKYQSRVLFRQLFENHAYWDKIDEARLIYADLNFTDNFFEEGLKSLDLIQDTKLNNIKNGILENYIPKIQNQSTLKDLFYKFPNNKILAKYLVKKIQSNRYNSKEDLELSDQLTNSFKLLDEDDAISSTKKRSNNVVNEKLNFAVLLPFQINSSLNNSINIPNQYVYDMYAGMEVAADKLAEEGIKINLNAFDVNKTKEDFLKYEKSGALKDYSVIIGPLFPTPNVLASSYVIANKIIQVHPLSNNITLVKDKNSIFLAQPSTNRQATKALDYVANFSGRKAVSIYYGPSKKDSLFAASYLVEAKAKGYKINGIRKFNGNLQNLAKEDGHIFFVADANLGTRFLQLMNRFNINSPLIVTATSFNWNNVDKTLFSDNVSILYPEFIDSSKESVVNFKKSYIKKMASLPSYYSYLGYDLIYYYSKMLKDGRDIFKINLESGPYLDDLLLSGFDYSDKKNENEIVPVVKWNNSTFEEIYR